MRLYDSVDLRAMIVIAAESHGVLDPLVFEDLVALLEEELPELALGGGLGDLGRGALAVAVLVLREGRDRQLEEVKGGRGELNGGGCLGFLLRDDSQGAASGDVVLGNEHSAG